MKLKQHKTLTEEKWSCFSLDQKILQIAVELQRGLHWHDKGDLDETKRCCERAFELIDLTVATESKKHLLKELLCFREELGKQYLLEEISGKQLQALYEAMLKLNGRAFCSVRSSLGKKYSVRIKLL